MTVGNAYSDLMPTILISSL